MAKHICIKILHQPRLVRTVNYWSGVIEHEFFFFFFFKTGLWGNNKG